MARVLGIGGVFFKARQPRELAEWYAANLGIELDPDFCGARFAQTALPPGAYVVWSPFEENSQYFAPSTAGHMINFVVDDLDAVLARVEAGGGSLAGMPEDSEFGRFGWVVDPEGNKIELWQPPPE